MTSEVVFPRPRVPVISVGNLAFGGRGKTPVVAYIAQLLIDAGERPAILTRGYARQRPEDGVVVVSDGEHILADLDRSGDEPLMLARALPKARVLVCEQRVLAAALAERHLGATVHLLDDGFQHRQMRRDVDLVLVHANDLADRRAPWGRLRESPSALARAHAVIGEGRPDAALPPGPRSFSFSRSLGTPYVLDEDAVPPTHPGPIVAAAGIADPARFWTALEAAGWHVVERFGFSDHHAFSRRDLDRIAEAAIRRGASVVTTEKDAMRLLPWRPLPVPFAVAPMTVQIEPADEFRRWLFQAIHEARA
jgi:tetraacyldisaccharide 4'-kinase